MGMFDFVEVEEMFQIEGCPPILPITNYQTKSLRNELKKYSLAEALKEFGEGGLCEEENFRLYCVFDEKLLQEFLDDKEINQACLFWIDAFSDSARSEWLEYSLLVERGKIKKVEMRVIRR